MTKTSCPQPTDVLIDAENLYTDGWWRHETAELTRRLQTALELVPPNARTLVVCCAALAYHLLDVLLTERVDLRVVPPTPDAADRLIAHHLQALPPTRHVLLVTGDGGLAHQVANHIAAGGHVTVAAIATHLSRKLRLAASNVHLLPLPLHTKTSTDLASGRTLRDVA